jgi:hypothetical protein
MATLGLQNFQNSKPNFYSDIQDEICQIVMAKHRFFKVGIHYTIHTINCIKKIVKITKL